MWPYAVFVVGAVVIAVGVGRRFWKRTNRGLPSIDMGRLSDSWLAEQRGNRDRSS